MSLSIRKRLHCLLSVFFFFSLTACDKISIPRLSFEQNPETKAPIAVIYRFDPALAQHTQVVDACGFPHTIQSGEIITKTFVQVGQEHFALVSTQPPTAAGTSAKPANALTVDLKFVQFSFEPIGRSGEEDRYHANVGLQLQALYKDSQGNVLAQTPLTYNDKAKLWTPALTSQSTSCATGQFDAVVENAAETLALDMVSVIPRLYGQAPPPPPAGEGYAAQFPSQSIPVHKPSLSFRTMLQDANDNLVLEGGENLVLQIETTNTSSEPLPSAYVELRGSQAIVNAFSQVTSLPISIGTIQPGEKKTTEVRGRMPINVEAEKGELVVSISISQGIPPGAHTILAAIQPGNGSVEPPLTQNAKKSINPPATLSKDSPYYAVVVGLDRYRDPWSKAHQVSTQHIQGITDALKTTGTFPQDHIKVLHGSHATRTDIEEVLFSWAQNKLTADSIFLFYFAGHSFVDSTKGEVYLVPYEGSPKASKKRLISLRSLQRVLYKLKVKVALLFLDTPVTQYLGKAGNVVGLNGSKPANWRAALPVKGKTNRTQIIQIRRLEGKSNSDPAQLLAGLLGSADLNNNGTVTLGELLKNLRKTAEIIPDRSQNLSLANIPLAQ